MTVSVGALDLDNLLSRSDFTAGLDTAGLADAAPASVAEQGQAADSHEGAAS